MSQRRVIAAVTLVGLLLIVPAIQGYEDGVYNRAYGCNCHSQSGQTAANVSISGLPSSYDANNLYQLTVDVSGGVQGSGGGFSLVVNKGTLSTGTGGMFVNVNNQGNSATHSITGSSYRSWSFEWTAPSAGAGSVTFEVAGMTSNGNGGYSGDRWSTSTMQIHENIPVNNPPSASNVLLTPTNPLTTDPLSLSYSYSDPDNDIESGSEITWYRDSQALTQGSITGSTVLASLTAKGQEWYAEITPSDGDDFGNMVTSNTVTIENSAPSLTSPEINPISPEENDDLTVTYSANDDDQDVLTIEIRWYLDGVLLTEFNDDTTIPSIATRQGDEWRVEVMVTDGEDMETRSSQIITIGSAIQPNNPPEITTLEITPILPTTDDNLQLIYLSQDLDNDQIIDVEIEWLKDGVMTDVTSLNLPSIETHKGQTWTVKLRLSDGKDWSAWHETSVIITNSPPVVDSIILSPNEVFTTDSILVDYTYTDDDGDESDNPAIIWAKNGIQQSALDGLNPLPAEYTTKGDLWTVSVKANDGESLSEVYSMASFTVQNSLPVIQIDEIPSNLTFANTNLSSLTIEPLFSDADDDQIVTSIQWLRNGFREGSLDNQTIVASPFFGAGQVWTLEILYHDNDGPIQQFSHTITVDNIAPQAAIEILSTNLWSGEIILLDAGESIDFDGTIVSYLWEFQDNSGDTQVTTGKQVEIIGEGTIGIILTVEDDLGLVGTNTRIIQTTSGPEVKSLSGLNTPTGVQLSWEWTGEEVEFTIMRNGIVVGITSDTTFTDKPQIAGSTAYTITPVVDQQGLIAGSQTITNFDVAIPVEAESAVSETGGFALGIAIMILSIGIISLSLLQRRDEPE